MDMDSFMMEMRESELKSMQERLAQYEKEYQDLTNGTGLAKIMSTPEILSAKRDLADHIANLKISISNFEKNFAYEL